MNNPDPTITPTPPHTHTLTPPHHLTPTMHTLVRAIINFTHRSRPLLPFRPADDSRLQAWNDHCNIINKMLHDLTTHSPHTGEPSR